MANQNFRVQNFRDTQGITEIHENIVSQIFGAIRSLPRLLLLWFVSESCQMSMSAQVILEWLHLPWKISQPAINHHMTGW